MLCWNVPSSIVVSRLHICRLSHIKYNSQAESCTLPVIAVAGKNLCVSGMCAIVRFLIRRRAAVAKRRGGRGFPGEKLLGYQGELCVVFANGEESEKGVCFLTKHYRSLFPFRLFFCDALEALDEVYLYPKEFNANLDIKHHNM